MAGAVTTDRPARRAQRSNLATGAVWLLGSAVVTLAQANNDRRLAAAGAAFAGIAIILVVRRLTPDPARRYFRSLVGAMVAVSVGGDWILTRLSTTNGFVNSGLDTRIALPLMFVLLAPVVLQALPIRLRSRALWRDRALVWRDATTMDWLFAAYALFIAPDLVLGLVHHAPKSYIAQDLGLVVFFVFAYIAGRAVTAEASRLGASELVDLLLALAVAQGILVWDTTPLFTYLEAACAAALAFALLQPRATGFLKPGLALVLLGADVLAIKHGSGTTTAIELAAALGVIAYLLVRLRPLMPQWLVACLAVVALAGFIAFTADGATLRGQYRGSDPSNVGRSYEAYQVRSAIRSSPVSFVFGRGLGGSVDETNAPAIFANTLVYGGRDLAHVQEIHNLPYEFLLKYGLLGFAWLAAFVMGAALLGIRALETALERRDPTPVVYAALPLLGITAAFAAATHLQDNPLNAFALGVLVTRIDFRSSSWLRVGLALPAAAVAGIAIGAAAFVAKPPQFVGSIAAGQPTKAAVVGDVRFGYPGNFHQRYFVSSRHAVSGRHGVRVNGVVVASYPLKRDPELGGPGATFPVDGIFFELYQIPRQRGHAAINRLPHDLKDYPNITGLPRATEQGGSIFSVKGRDYRAILWLGPDAPHVAQTTMVELIASIQVNPPSPHKHPHTKGDKVK